MMLGEIDFLTVYVYPWLVKPGSGSAVPAVTPQGGGRRSGLRSDQLAALGNVSTAVNPIRSVGGDGFSVA